MEDGLHMRILAEASGLSRAAAAARRAVPFTSAEWQFYRGVERSAEEMLHPDIALATADGSGHWPAEPRPFRTGYAEGHHLFTMAITEPEPPTALRLPRMQDRR
jgi:hypothetical protein